MTETTTHTGEMAIMTREDGDLRVHWDAEKEDEVAHAKETFEKWKAKGYAAFRVNREGNQGEQIRTFDPDEEAIILTPPMVAG